MSGKKIYEFIRKYKIILMIGFFVVLLAIMIPVIYVHGHHTPTLFNDEDAKVISLNKLEKETGISDFNLTAAKIKYANNTDGFTSGSMTVNTTFKADSQIKDLTISYMLTCNWDKDWEKNSYTKESVSKTYEKNDDSSYSYTTTETTLYIYRQYPFKPNLLFVKVDNPTIYVRITLTNRRGNTDKYYVKIKDSAYITDNTEIN